MHVASWLAASAAPVRLPYLLRFVAVGSVQVQPPDSPNQPALPDLTSPGDEPSTAAAIDTATLGYCSGSAHRSLVATGEHRCFGLGPTAQSRGEKQREIDVYAVECLYISPGTDGLIAEFDKKIQAVIVLTPPGCRRRCGSSSFPARRTFHSLHVPR